MSVKSSELLSQSQYARRIGRSPSRISQLVKTGIIQLMRGRIDPGQADTAIEKSIDLSKGTRSLMMKARNADRSRQLVLLGQQGAYEPNSLTEMRRQHEVVKMELSKLRLEVEKGNLVPRNQVIEWAIRIVANARIKLLGLPRRTSETFAVLLDRKEIEEIHLGEIKSILHELAMGFGLNEEGRENIAAEGGGEVHGE